MPSQHRVIRYALPWRSCYNLGKAPIQNITMGETAVSYPQNSSARGSLGFADQASPEDGIPVSGRREEIDDPPQILSAETLKNHIIFKYHDVPCVRPDSLLQAAEVGLKYSQLGVAAVLLHDQKLNPAQQAHFLKLRSYPISPVSPFLDGNTVDLVKKIPAFRTV